MHRTAASATSVAALSALRPSVPSFLSVGPSSSFHCFRPAARRVSPSAIQSNHIRDTISSLTHSLSLFLPAAAMALDDGRKKFLWLSCKVDESTFKGILTLQSIYHLHTIKYISKAVMNLYLKRCHVRWPWWERKRRRCARARPLFLPFFLPSFLAQYRDVSVHLNPIPIPLPPLCLLTSFARKTPFECFVALGQCV